MNLAIHDSYFISDIKESDGPAYIEHLKEKQIYDQTLTIPFPYTENDALWWIHHIEEETKKQGRSVNWAIRKQDGFLIGGIGFTQFELGTSYKAEIGYWLAKPYWGQGIVTGAVKKVCDVAFKEFRLIRITANVFTFNIGSVRVLEKAGFQKEGHLRKNYRKNGKCLDGYLYARVVE